MLNMLAMNRPLTAEQRLQRCVVSILGHPRYIALCGVVMLGTRVIVDDPAVRTACTDGLNEKYSRAFVDSLSDPELIFVILHETYHKLFRHLVTWQWLYALNPRKANMACDYVINLLIVLENADGFAVMPKGGLLDRKFMHMDTAQVFNLIPDDDGNGEGGAGDAGDGGGEGFDQHDWESAKSMTDAEVAQVKEQIDRALRQGMMSATKLGNDGASRFAELLEPEVDWREVMRNFFTETCRGDEDSTFRVPERRALARGLLRPSSISEQVDEIIFANDLSGSVSRQLGKYMGEMKSLLETVKVKRVRVLYWDTKICREEIYGEGGTAPISQLISTTKPAGGGGTDVRCVSNYIKENNLNPSAVVVFTDGYLGSEWGTWSHPLMWCIVDNKSAKPKNGKSVHVKL